MSSAKELNANSPSLSDGRNSNGVQSNSDRTENNLIEKSLSSSNDTLKDQGQLSFGWLGLQPRCLQGLLSAKWSLFWMCWAGALQGNDRRRRKLKQLQFRVDMLLCHLRDDDNVFVHDEKTRLISNKSPSGNFFSAFFVCFPTRNCTSNVS